MVIVVAIINIIISLVLIYIAGYLSKLKHQLAAIADRLTAYERSADKFLTRAPKHIAFQRQNISNLHQGQQHLALQILQIQQMISLVGIGRKLWQYFFSPLKGKSGKMSSYTGGS